MVTTKRLVLLLLTAIVMASVACGFIQPKEPTVDEQIKLIEAQKSVMLCQEAMERRAESQAHIDDIWIMFGQGVSSTGADNLNKARVNREMDLLLAEGDMKKFCEPPTPVPTPTPNA